MDSRYGNVCPACNSPACVGVTPVSVWCSKTSCKFADRFQAPKYGDIVTVKLGVDKVIRSSDTEKLDGKKMFLAAIYSTIVEVRETHSFQPRKYALLPTEIIELAPFLVWVEEVAALGIPTELQFTAPFMY